MSLLISSIRVTVVDVDITTRTTLLISRDTALGLDLSAVQEVGAQGGGPLFRGSSGQPLLVPDPTP